MMCALALWVQLAPIGTVRLNCTRTVGKIRFVPVPFELVRLCAPLFSILVEPLLRNMRFEVQEKCGGIVRACAADIGMAIVTINTLVNTNLVFDFAEALAGLALNPRSVN